MPFRNAARSIRLIVWCKACQHQVEPDAAEIAERYRFEPAVSYLGGEMGGVRTVRMPLGQHGGERDDAAVTPTRPHLESRRRRAAREPRVSSGFKVVGMM